MQKKINYLGYIIEDGIISASNEKVTTVARFPTPHNIKTTIIS